MTNRKLAQQVKEHIEKNETTACIQLLKDALAAHNLYNTILLKAAQQYGLERKILTGQVSWAEAEVSQNLIHNAILSIVDELAQEEIRQTKVFISYNREPVSQELAQQLRREIKRIGFPVFMDFEDTPIGADWALTILEEIKSCTYFILLLSEAANESEMVIKEIEEAHKLKIENGHPIILPIRVQYPLANRLNARLHGKLFRIQQLTWDSSIDTPNTISQILEVLLERREIVIANPEMTEEVTAFAPLEEIKPIPVAPLEIPRGAVRLESKFYVKRKHEDIFIQFVESPAALLRIRGPRQYGKTSLLTRVIAHADQLNYTIIAIDFQEIDEATMTDLDQLLWEFCYYLADELGLEDELNKRWSTPRAKKQITTSFIEKNILRQQDQPILLALDEADRLFSFPEVSSEFFLLLRSWHERSKVPNKQMWEKFRLVLSYSTEAKLAIQNLNASPFNVGEEADLYPFTKEQVAELATRHGLVWTEEQLDIIMKLLAGQPYLVRRAMFLIAKGENTFDTLIEQADKHGGPFSDHLRHHLVNLKQFAKNAEAMREILDIQRFRDPLIATRLAAAGLIKGSPPNLEPACGLYATYFRGKL